MNIDYWIAHFRRNGIERPEPDWDAPLDLQGKRLAKLTRSIQQFQLGDGGGPAYLIAWNRESLLTSDPGIHTLVDLWFAEEVEHSRLLGVMLARLGGRPIDNHWSFGLFCGLRKWLGVGFELYALLLTEIVSHVYYKMLHRHGGDEALRGMCRLIIRDEAGHIAFHRARLASDGRHKGKRYGRLWEALFRLRGLTAGTVLWINHRGALVALGATDREFYSTIWRDMGKFIAGLREDVVRNLGADASLSIKQECKTEVC
ncbi:ferritin-like domain-containing protein [Luteolibacter ambystomatis]|uniref:Ferritin-like domain-containing protein n=1 Tax=Luteolibacter ambystomatis TaxID=2824561 RepID=A0A975PG78_9BACT|nr:ferritin-like domain-containing protein [Luteolibacter ambystomatis]QUE52046.1 ferritin-like domain-containing protein [Luteolibacter ambystomatis]